MAGLFRRHTAAEEAGLAAANPRDRAVARWYSWVQVGGGILVAFYFVVFFAPAVVHTVRWVVSGLAASSPTASRFWVRLVSGCVAVVPVMIPAVTYLQECWRRLARRAAQ